MTHEQKIQAACITTDCPISSFCARQNEAQYPTDIMFPFQFVQTYDPTDEPTANCDYFEQLTD